MGPSLARASTTLVAILALFVSAVAIDPQSIVLDAARTGLTFDGIGALSAGGSSRLLRDYREPSRSQILDYLFKPGHGASLQVLKIEIGGDTQSTDGTEPSHMHYRNETSLGSNCNRGYEWWLAKEARARNPAIALYGLSWGAPAWICDQRGYYSCGDNAAYHIEWLRCGREVHGLEVQWLGLWNEMSWGTPAFVKDLRAALDAADFGGTQLALIDGDTTEGDPFWSNLTSDAAFADAVGAIGLHYPCNRARVPAALSRTAVVTAGKKFWASEDFWSRAGWDGARCWARTLNWNYLRFNMTSSIAYTGVWSAPPQVTTFAGPGWGPGFVYAWRPYSGHFEVGEALWATAHTAQFTRPGWTYLLADGDGLGGGGGGGFLAGGGSYVTLLGPEKGGGRDFTVVLETSGMRCSTCAFPGAPRHGRVRDSQAVTFQLRGAALEAHAGAVLTLVTSNATAQLVQRPGGITVDANATFTLNLPPEMIFTVTSLRWDGPAPDRPVPPPDAPLPLPYTDPFEEYAIGREAKYFADQAGSWEVANGGATGINQFLRQMVLSYAGVNAWASQHLTFPATVMGELDWLDVMVNVTVRLPSSASAAASGAFVALCVHVTNADFHAPPVIAPVGLCLNLTAAGTWTLTSNLYSYERKVVANGTAPGGRFDPSAWHTLTLATRDAGGSHPTKAYVVVDGAVFGQRGPFMKGAGHHSHAGMVALCSGWHLADFDDFSVSAFADSPFAF